VGTLSVVGARAIARNLKPPVGLLTETPLCDGLPFPGWGDLVFGGHEVRDTDFGRAAAEFAERAGVLDGALLHLLREDLARASEDLRPGFLVNPSRAVKEMARRGRVARGGSPRLVVEGIQQDLREFQARHDLAEVVVVNVSSTEPSRELPIEFAHLEGFERALETRSARARLTSGVLHAYAALDAGFPFVNFTPSPGSTIPALMELAEARGVCHMGNDGKTGETLVKTVLAPLFAGRALRVLSWEGYNLLGNRDGYVLDDPKARESKTRSKDKALRGILKDERLHAKVTIDYVPSLDDWKVAWDYVHFEGFLGAKMSMQFTWQGNDSALAAPLVLDLARWTALARAEGETGLLPWLAAYFKSPAGVEEQGFVKQLELLERWVAAHRGRQGESTRGKA
jgi:myo-inositol-1-phosphate synthase